MDILVNSLSLWENTSVERKLLHIDRTVATLLGGGTEIFITATYPNGASAPCLEAKPDACDFCVFQQLKRCPRMVCETSMEQGEDGEDVPVFKGSVVISGTLNNLKPPCRTRDSLWFRLTPQRPKVGSYVPLHIAQSSPSDGLSVYDYK